MKGVCLEKGSYEDCREEFNRRRMTELYQELEA